MTTPDRLAAQAEPLSELEELRRELHLMKTAGIIEVAVRNPSVSEYMEHWEGRALKAESLATPVPGAVSNAMVERAWDRLFPGNLTVISITKADLTTALEAAVQSPPIVGVKALAERERFPILQSGGQTIDFELVADHGKQAQKNHYQTVKGLAGRGGLSWCEMYAVLHNRPWQKMDENEAILACRALEARYLSALVAPVEAVATEPVGLHIVFDGPPSHESGRFVEVETPDGKSINAGEWHERLDGLWELRLVHPTGDSGALREALDGLNLLLGQAIHHLRNHDIYTHKTYADLANELQVWAKEHRAALSKGEPGK